MLGLVIDPNEWARRYGLEIEEKECLGCKKIYPVNEPFAIKGYRGLRMADHGCLAKYRRALLVPQDESEVRFWNDQFLR